MGDTSFKIYIEPIVEKAKKIDETRAKGAVARKETNFDRITRSPEALTIEVDGMINRIIAMFPKEVNNNVLVKLSCADYLKWLNQEAKD